MSELHYIHEVLKRKTLPDSEWHVLKDIVKEPGIDAASKGVFPSRSKAILTGTLANNSPHLSYASIESAKVHFETGYKIADRLIEKNAYYAAAFVNQAAIKAEIMHDAMKKLMDYSVGKVPYSIEDRFTEIQSCLDDYKLLSGKNLKIEGSPQEYYEKFFKRPNMIGIDFAAVEGVCNLFWKKNFIHWCQKFMPCSDNVRNMIISFELLLLM